MSDDSLPTFQHIRVVADDVGTLAPPDVFLTDRVRAFLDDVRANWQSIDEKLHELNKLLLREETQLFVGMARFLLRVDILRGPKYGSYNSCLRESILSVDGIDGDELEDRESLNELFKAVHIQKVRSLGVAAVNVCLGWSRLYHLPPRLRQIAGALDEFHVLYAQLHACQESEWDDDHVRAILCHQDGIDGLCDDSEQRKERAAQEKAEQDEREKQERIDRAKAETARKTAEIERKRLENLQKEAQRKLDEAKRMRQAAEQAEQRAAAKPAAEEVERRQQQAESDGEPIEPSAGPEPEPPIDLGEQRRRQAEEQAKKQQQVDQWKDQPQPAASAARTSPAMSLAADADVLALLSYLCNAWGPENRVRWLREIDASPESFAKLYDRACAGIDEVRALKGHQ